VSGYVVVMTSADGGAGPVFGPFRSQTIADRFAERVTARIDAAEAAELASYEARETSVWQDEGALPGPLGRAHVRRLRPHRLARRLDEAVAFAVEGRWPA
jgi:hypothetical protein